MTGAPRADGALLLAGVDIGTLTCRLLIAAVHAEGRLTEVESDRRILRLGEGLEPSGRLQPEPMARVIATLREWQRRIETYPVSGRSVVGTSAVRGAGNQEEFLDRVKRETGFEVEVIAGDEEARRTLLGIRSGLPSGVTSCVVLDIGGGSTEFMLDRPGASPILHSIELGVVRLTERLLRHDPPTTDEVAAARDQISRAATAARVRLADLSGTTFVGTAGTITTLAAMAQRLPTYEPARIHHFRLALGTVRDLEHGLLARTKAQRKGLPGLERGREDVIVAGALILREVMETFGARECLVSDLGLREGVVIDLAQRLCQAGAGL